MFNQIIKKKHNNVYHALGKEPHTVENFLQQDYDFIKNAVSEFSPIAIGEIGLDYHYGENTKEKQRDVFQQMLQLADEFELPVIIHCREAEEDIISIIKNYSLKRRGVFHCFTGDYSFARKILDMGFLLSFSGIVTFRTAVDLQNVAKNVSTGSFLIETDAPYLAPVPKRGKKNLPEYLVYTAEFLAQLRSIDIEVLAENTSETFIKLFEPGQKL